MPFDLGATARLTAECRDPGGALVTADTVVVTISLPDGTSTTAAADETDTVGQYQADHVAQQPGRHSVRWTFGGPAHAYTDSFDVREALPPSILSLADAKGHLRLTDTSQDEAVRGWVESVTAGIEGLCGAVAVRTVTQRCDIRRARLLALTHTPVLDLLAVDPILGSGPGYAVADLDVDEATGVIQLKDGGTLTGPLRVTYSVGRRIVPSSMSAAARIILQHLWRTQQGPGRPQMGVGDFDVTEPVSGFGYAIPNRALQLLEPYRLPPGVG